MPQPIRVLDPSVADRIAAGEVVERPASVVKELIENALDAGGTMIQVEVGDGGLRLIRVSDNGGGIPRGDLPLAVERFATSKVATAEDLAAIRTLGFRGEALPAVAAVADVEVTTRAGDEVEGSLLRVVRGERRVEAAASPVGASVVVRDLFARTPARRKFMKSPLREQEQVRDTVVRYALGYPEVAFRLILDRREALVAPPARSLLERIGAVLGRDLAGDLVEASSASLDLRVSGYVSTPALARAGRDAQVVFVNRRPVRAGLLGLALERPYAGLLPPGRHPVAVLFVEIDPGLVDVNVHPRKAEVRFAQERAVYWAVHAAVEAALRPFPRTAETTGAWPAPASEVREAEERYREGGGLRPIGQLHATYLLAQSRDGLVLVDQHAAHEQVLYERLTRGGSRELPAAARLDLTAREREALDRAGPALEAMGFVLEPFGPTTQMLRAVPADLPETDLVRLVALLLDEATRVRGEGVLDALASRAACLTSVRAGDPLSGEEQARLLADLEAAWSPLVCPHGRPAMVVLATEEIERRFLRR